MKHDGYQIVNKCTLGHYPAASLPLLSFLYLGANPLFVSWLLYNDTQSEVVLTAE